MTRERKVRPPRAEPPHVDGRIEACLDGELSPAEGEAVRAHCARCPRCARLWAEAQAVREALATLDSPDHSPAPSLWPLLQERRAARATPRVRLAVALGSASAAVAGLFLGLVLGARGPSGEEAWSQETWSEVGTLLADESSGTLDAIYWAAVIEEGEQVP